jgi:hypothetical protein
MKNVSGILVWQQCIDQANNCRDTLSNMKSGIFALERLELKDKILSNYISLFLEKPLSISAGSRGFVQIRENAKQESKGTGG